MINDDSNDIRSQGENNEISNLEGFDEDNEEDDDYN